MDIETKEGQEVETGNTQEQAQGRTEIELRAIEMGWRPRDEFDGSDDDFIDAKEFVRRKPLFDRIESQSREIKSVKKALEAWKDHYTKVKEVEYERALGALKEARKGALRDGDADQFEHFDNEINRVEKEADLIRAAQEQPIVREETVHPEFQAWLNKNRWYGEAGYMKVFADDVGNKLAAQGMSPSDVLKEVEKAVRKEFPNRFRNPNKETAPDTDSSRSSGKATKSDDFELSEVERRIMNTLIASDPKNFSKEKYIADLKKIKNR